MPASLHKVCKKIETLTYNNEQKQFCVPIQL